MDINLTIAGGCFTQQHNIKFENLYHQIVKKNIENVFNCKLNISIIRYERFNKCFDKIEKSYLDNPIDILIFHIRSEQFLRMSKLYYKFSDDKGVIRHSLNLPLFNFMNPEKYGQIQNEMLTGNVNSDITVRSSKFKKYLTEMNYVAGILSGNVYSSQKKYLKLIERVFSFCKEKKIKFILVGPVSRPHTKAEDILTGRLNCYIHASMDANKIKFINCLGKLSENNEPLFFKNGIYVNETGHERIAGFITNEISDILISERAYNSILNKQNKL